MKNIDPAVINMNLIAMYEQGYLSLYEFINAFPDSISESQECLFGSKCIEFYVAVTLGRTDCRYYVQKDGENYLFDHVRTQDKILRKYDPNTKYKPGGN